MTKPTLQFLVRLCAGFLGCICVAAAGADDAANASPETRVLDQFVGKWDEEMTNKPTEWTPNSEKSTAITTRKWALGKKFIRGEGSWKPAENEYLHLLAFDADAKVFRTWYFDSSGGMPRGSVTGQWNEKSKTITWHGTDENGNKVTGTHRLVDRNNQEWTYVIADPAGKTLLDLTGKCRRRKE